MYMFFLVPNDLTRLDIANGQCYNSSIKQNVTFGYQNLPFKKDSLGASVTVTSWVALGISIWWALSFGVSLPL